jgi:hypothetical protein
VARKVEPARSSVDHDARKPALNCERWAKSTCLDMNNTKKLRRCMCVECETSLCSLTSLPERVTSAGASCGCDQTKQQVRWGCGQPNPLRSSGSERRMTKGIGGLRLTNFLTGHISALPFLSSQIGVSAFRMLSAHRIPRKIWRPPHPWTFARFAWTSVRLCGCYRTFDYEQQASASWPPSIRSIFFANIMASGDEV